MESLQLRMDRVFKGARNSFSRFPAAIVSAIVISVIAVIKIKMGWHNQKPYALLFDSIQMAFLLGAVFSMASAVFYEISSGKEKSFFMLINIAGILLAGISFLLLYFFGEKIGDDKTAYLSSVAVARVSVGIFISGVAFVYIISKAVESFSDSFFITHRAFIVSGIYGLVMMLGVSGVLGAFQALIYKDMTYRMYQYLGVAVGLLSYLIFLGYFPKFGEVKDESEIAKVKERPRFIVVLLDYIVIPIMVALTVVLLIWSVRVIFKGVDTTFNGLSGIASSYVIVGIWLHIMVAKHESKIAGFYRKIYPVAGILILAFEAWALYVQISQFGLQTAEYSFLIIWVFALISVVLLMVLAYEDGAYRKIAVTAVVLSIIWVLPIVGYQDVTFNSQVKRLEKLLLNNEFLVGGEIVAKDETIDYEIKEEITSAVQFIAYSDKVATPSWFREDMNDYDVFRETFGFQKTFGRHPGQSQYSSMDFRLDADVVDISEYDLSLNIEFHGEEEYSKKLGGSYEILISNYYAQAPTITVKHEDRVIVEKGMGEHFANLMSDYPQEVPEVNLPYDDMNMVIEAEDLEVLVVFKMINMHMDKETNHTDYYVEFQGVYVKDK